VLHEGDPDVARAVQEVSAALLHRTQEALRVGSRVKVSGLQQAGELNGQKGTCRSWNAETQRWKVQLDNLQLKSIKPQNLENQESADV